MTDVRRIGRAVGIVAMVAVGQLGSWSNASAQTCTQATCNDTITPPSANSDQSDAAISLVSGTCTTQSGLVEDGTYVKKGSQLTIHSWTFSDGHCFMRACSGWPPQCVLTSEWARFVQKITMERTDPGGSASPSDIAPNPGTQELQTFDSHSTNTTGPLNETLHDAGTYSFEFWSTIYTTICDIEPGASPVLELRLHSLKCDPEFNLAGNPAQIRHLPQQLIKIYVPSDISGLLDPIEVAAASWQSAIIGTGITCSVSTTPCSSGGDCVIIEEAALSAEKCAETIQPVNLATGESNNPATVRIREGWENRPAERLQRSMAHELGHLHCAATAVGLNP